jgi:Domain of unknown function (DUF5666)
MRKYIVLGLTLLLVSGAVLLAQTSGSTSGGSSSGGSMSGDSMSKGSTKDYKRMHGDIASIDATAQTFTVSHGKDTSTFKTDGSTKYKGLGKTISFSDLQVGDDVRVSYTENGSDKTAARVDVAHHKKS